MATRQAFLRNIRDKDVRQTIALPNAASTTVHSPNIDLGAITPQGARPDRLDLVFKIAALNTTMLPDTKTTTLTIENSDDPNFGSLVDTLVTLVVTGAGGVGAAASEARCALGNNINKRYVRGTAVTGALTTDQSAVIAEFCIAA